MIQPSKKLLRFRKGGNAKLDKDTWSFSLPAGWSCPGAKECMTKVDPDVGKIIDGKFQRFRCFAAIDETRPNVRQVRWNNFKLLTEARTRKGMYELIRDSFPAKVKKMRIHVSGDFFNTAYFAAWCDVATHFSSTLFYAYTKSLQQVRPHLEKHGLPKNFKLTLSEGGVWDDQLDQLNTLAEEIGVPLGSVEVVFHPDDAKNKQLPVDHDDSHAVSGDHKFALLVHSMQPAGSDAAEAIRRMKRENVKFSYSSTKPKRKKTNKP